MTGNKLSVEVENLRPLHSNTLFGFATRLADQLYEDHNVFRDRVDAALKDAYIKLSAADRKQILKAGRWCVETAPPIIARTHKPGKVKADPLRGL